MGGDGEQSTQRVETRLSKIESILKELKDQIGGLTRKITKMEGKFIEQDKLLENIDTICKESEDWRKQTEFLKAENLTFKQKIKEIEYELIKQESQKRRNVIEIYGIPKSVNENPVEIVISLSKAAKVGIEKSEIEDCFRGKDINGRERPIIVKFKNAEKRDKLIKAAKQARIKLKNINMNPENKNIYVNDSLIPKIKQLLYKVKNTARDKAWKFVWIYKGEIFIKKTEGEAQIKISNEDDLETLLR